MVTSQVWALLRQAPGTEHAEVLAVFADPPPAALVDELGPGHYVAPGPLVPPEPVSVRVAHTWSCRMTVEAGAVERDTAPVRLAGASRLLLGEEEDDGERLLVDDGAADLENAVHGRTVVYVTALAGTADRAYSLALECAEKIAAEQRDIAP